MSTVADRLEKGIVFDLVDQDTRLQARGVRDSVCGVGESSLEAPVGRCKVPLSSVAGARCAECGDRLLGHPWAVNIVEAGK